MLTVEIKRDTPTRYIRWLTIGNVFHKYRSQVVTYWYENGQKYLEEYLVNGEYYREPLLGPAYTVWHKNGRKDYEEYYVDGKQVELEDYDANH